ncbi:glycosyltransferase family 2 protein [Hyphococcus flavus]|uniref:Glycosyltransferase family 2 protein n=1 Tax=Hyphococcus flavus TaxID=1866326 RepID=A0AAE9ZCV3_9PROT|nr:glycosyltransferase family 2 protein [Hyphococcus flavus]WDI32603.1 glycosyltransferase family 2 protein [Hyphococcus flavus]
MTASNLKPPISAYIRTLNEERMIGEVVRAALQVVQEVIVIDSGSTDRTIEIAEDAGARVIHHEWLGNGHQKRLAEDACANDWLLDLDADELISSALAAEIAAKFRNGEPEQKIYMTPLALAPPVGRPWRDFGLQKRHKLYDRRVVRAPSHKAWDQFDIPSGVNLGRLNEPILHHAFTGAEQFIAKVNRNSSVRAQALPLKSKPYLALRILFGLPVYFSKKYFLQQYFRGGVYGFALAMVSGYGRWMRDVKMWERASKNPHAPEL